MNPEILFRDTRRFEVDDRRFEAVEADALRSVAAEHQRLALFQVEGRIVLTLFVGESRKCAVVEDRAVLVNLDDRGAFVSVGALENLLHHLAVAIHDAGHEGAASAEGQGDGVDRVIDHAARRGDGSQTDLRGGRVLPLGQAVNLVVEQHDVQVEVAANGVNVVVAADRERVAVAGADPDAEVRAGRLQAGGHRHGASVDAVHAIGVDVIGQPRRAADARDHDNLFGFQAQLGHRVLELLENHEVTAAGAPFRLLVRRKILGGQTGMCIGHDSELL